MTEIAQIGDVLAGKYRVDKILGIGGMGMVVAATHLDLEHRVALKFMLPQAAESHEATKRFMREARASTALSGEHICRVIDLGRLDNGMPYIVMEYLEGYDLQSLLKRRGPLKLSDAVDYVLQACEGMAEAHMHGIVHRDLKPGNLFVTKRADGSPLVKVLDFGISKAAMGGMNATRTGDVMGSPAYMSPEQMESTKDVDQRADIWSLGVILYQLVTGRTPFQADTLPGLCLRVMNDPPDPIEALRADLPFGFSEAVMRALEKDRRRRYNDVGEFASMLGPFGGDTASYSVTRIWGVLHPPEPSSRSSFPDTDVVPTQIGSESMEIVVAQPTADHRQPAAAPPAKASVTTFSSGAAESMHRVPMRRVFSYGWLGALVVAVGVVVLVLVMVMKSGNDATSGSAVQPAEAPLPATTTNQAPPPPPKQVAAPLPPVPPPDPPVHVDAAPVVHPKKPPKPPKPPADGAGSDDDQWTHMQHDRGSARP
jgi:serine/threonine-protein kinase